MSAETAPRFSSIGGHHSHSAMTVEWVTPPSIIAALGPFDLDPCAAVAQPWLTAARSFTKADDGLKKPWRGRVWMNPPYANGIIGRWLARMAAHGNGTALIFARTETDAFFKHAWNEASAMLFMRGRVTFHVGEDFVHPKTGKRWRVGDLAVGNAGAPTVLCAYGVNDADVLAACEIDGKFVPLRFPRSVLTTLFRASNEDEKSDDVTWREAVAAFFAGRDGPVELQELYAAFASHPKSKTNRNVQAKLRQQLQRGPYRRVERGLWEMEHAD